MAEPVYCTFRLKLATSTNKNQKLAIAGELFWLKEREADRLLGPNPHL